MPGEIQIADYIDVNIMKYLMYNAIPNIITTLPGLQRNLLSS